MPRLILTVACDSTSLQAEWGEDFELRCWDQPAAFRAEADPLLSRAAGIVLGEGCGLEEWLSNREPVCPVVSLAPGPLLSGGWPVVARLEPAPAENPGVARMLRSLTGLALGDALGEMLSFSATAAPERLAGDDFPGTWYHTDDTEMSLAVCSILRAHGSVHQDALVARFVRRFQLDPDRGYGKMTRIQLRQLADGADWRALSRSAFSGQGSMGNGSAMRAAPLGAYFAEDLPRCVAEARASSVVTHAHPEAVAGAIAVAVAAALACRSSRLELEEILDLVPTSEVRTRLQQATAFQGSHLEAARLLGNGFQVTAQDTVPYCLWLAARSTDYVQAIGQAIQANGDCDTCAAITGAIVALTAPKTVPAHWMGRLELGVTLIPP